MSLSCEICYETYSDFPTDRQPRLLPCGHDLCTRCIYSLCHTAGSEPSCPKCRCDLFCRGDGEKQCTSGINKNANTSGNDGSLVGKPGVVSSSAEYLVFPVLRCLLQIEARLDFSGTAPMNLIQKALQVAPSEFLQMELEHRKVTDILEALPLDVLQHALNRRKAAALRPCVCSKANPPPPPPPQWSRQLENCSPRCVSSICHLSPSPAATQQQLSGTTQLPTGAGTSSNNQIQQPSPLPSDDGALQFDSRLCPKSRFMDYYCGISPPMQTYYGYHLAPPHLTPYPFNHWRMSQRQYIPEVNGWRIFVNNTFHILFILWSLILNLISTFTHSARWFGSLFHGIHREQQIQLVMMANAIPLLIGSFFVFWNPTLFTRFRVATGTTAE